MVQQPVKSLIVTIRYSPIVWALPILAITALVDGTEYDLTDGEISGSTVSSIMLATVLMIVFRKRYPRWWFEFLRELTAFLYRVSADLCLLTDRYPSTVEEQAVHLEIDYPDVGRNLNRWLPVIKWLPAIPHIVVLVVLMPFVALAVIAAWFSILLTGRYPESLFSFVVGVSRWSLRVQAYGFLLVTDECPPFSLY